MINRRAYLSVLLGVFTLSWLLLAVSPYARDTWLLENLLLVVGVLALLASHRALPLSRISYTLIFLFLLLHSIGAHYTYSLVPWTDWMEAIGLGVLAPADAVVSQQQSVGSFIL